MKYKMLVLILFLTVMSWAQSATPSASSTPQQSTVPADQANNRRKGPPLILESARNARHGKPPCRK
jgi:hypothetical protein